MNTVELGLPVVTRKPVPRPEVPHLIDTFGRRATDLRVSLIDKCNLRCTYCMPAEGLPWLRRDQLLSTEELVRLIRLAVRDLGITEVRFTGGEPLVRADVAAIVEAVAALPDPPRMALTTNGLGLARQAATLAAAGLARVNVSLDSIRPDTFRVLTRRDRLPDVLAGLTAAKAAGLAPVKVNAVLMRGINDDQAVELLQFCLDSGYQLRFIEQMPLDAQHDWRREDLVSAGEILDRLSLRFTLTAEPGCRDSAPAQRWLVDGGPDTVGIIASVSEPFCARCDRTRLTADGQVRNCLFATQETDLRGPMRAGADDAELAWLWRNTMWAKAPGHDMASPEFVQPARPMSAIGG